MTKLFFRSAASRALALTALLGACGGSGSKAPGTRDAGSDGQVDASQRADGGTPDAEGPVDAGSPRAAIEEGTRLKAVFYTDGRGARLFSHWVDRERNDARCDFALYEGAQGKRQYACAAAQRQAVSSGFGDPSCTKALALVDSSIAAGELVTSRDGTYCAGPGKYISPLYVTGELVSASDMYAMDNGKCVPSPYPGTPRAAIPVDFGSLVTAERVERKVAGSSDLRVASLEASDGSRQVVSSWLGDVPCQAWRETDSTNLRCIPTPKAFLAPKLYFADASCQQRVAVRDGLGDSQCDLPTALIYETSTDKTGGVFRTLHALGAAVDPVYADDDGACEATSATQVDWATFNQGYRVGASLPWSGFPILTASAEQGPTRLQNLRLTTSDGQELPSPGLFDTALDQTCGPYEFEAATGALCVPNATASSYEPSFGDPTCTKRVAWFRDDVVSDMNVAFLATISEETLTGLFEAAPHAGEVYRKNDEGECVVDGRLQFPYVIAGKQIPLTSLVPLQLEPR